MAAKSSVLMRLMAMVCGGTREKEGSVGSQGLLATKGERGGGLVAVVVVLALASAAPSGADGPSCNEETSTSPAFMEGDDGQCTTRWNKSRD